MKFEANTGALPRATTRHVLTLNGKPERMAWVVLFGAFFTCIGLTLLIPFFGLQFLNYSTLSQTASLQTAPLRPDKVTPVRVALPNVAQPIAVLLDPTEIVENSRIETDTTDDSRAFMTFFENSTATIYKNTQLVLSTMRQPQFGMSALPNSIIVDQLGGDVRYGVASPLSLTNDGKARESQFLVRTPNFDVWLNPGSYAIGVTADGAQVSVRDGNAVVVAKDGSRQVNIGQGQRVVFNSKATVTERDSFVPLPAAQDLLVNSDFKAPIDCSPNATGPWKCFSDQGGDGGEANGSIQIVEKDNRQAVQIKRANSNQNSAITALRQTIDRDVSDYRSLVLSADVRVDSHNLSGGGYLSSEYPLILRIRYRDVNGDEAEYVRGFYAQNTAGNPTVNGELVPRGQWIPIDSSNLLASLPIKPFRILAVEIYASGWDYESYVSNVRLKAE